MNSLFYQVSWGTGCYISSNYNITDSRGGNNRFTIYAYGDPIEPKMLKNKLFRCRNLISVINCTYLGKNRDSMPAEHLSVACNVVNDASKELVVIDDLVLDMDDSSTVDFLKSLPLVISSEIRKKFGVDDNIVICLFVNDEELSYLKKNEIWGSSCTTNTIVLNGLYSMSEKEFCSLLKSIRDDNNLVIKSNGLASNEYIKYVRSKGFCYEDDCQLGYDAEGVYNLLFNELGWAKNKNFYIHHLS